MYKIDYYKEEREKDSTYDEAYYNSLNNGNNKWGNIYTILKEKYDLCYNIESITIDVDDVEKMRYDCFSNGVLLRLYLLCKKNHFLSTNECITIPNNSIYSEELIYNILKSDWLINEDLVNTNGEELQKKKNYFEAIIEVSEDCQDIKIQFRNKLYSYFLETYEKILKEEYQRYESGKVLKLDMTTK